MTLTEALAGLRCLLVPLICLVLAVCPAAVPCAAEEGVGRVIRVGGNRDYPPYELLDKDGRPAGFTVDLVRAIAEVMGMKVDVNLGEWAKRHDDLKDGRIDMTLGMNYSEEREKIFDFSSPHTIVQQAIFARRGSPVAGTLEELRGKRVILHRNGIMHERLKKLGYEKDLVFADTPAGSLRMLASGEGDYALVALLPGMYIIRENKLTNLIPMARNVASFKFSFAVREGDTELLAKLNEGLAILKKTGQYQAIYDKWLGVLEPPRITWDRVLRLGAMVVVPLMLLLAGTVVWSRTLQKRVARRTAELAREVAEKNDALDALHLHQDKLIQADKMASLGILVSGVAHEINNPNSLILLNAPAIQDAFDDVEAILDSHCREHGDFSMGGIPYSRMRQHLPQLIIQIQDSARRIKRIVDDLKNFARQEQTGLKVPFDLNEVARQAVRLVHGTITASTRHFTTELTEPLPPVLGTQQRIEQVVVNLLLNACQALPDKGRAICLATGRDRLNGLVTLVVRDEGAGIQPEHLKHLTDPFFTTKREQGGTGLGLSISGAIVKEHGGVLEFDSTPGMGTTVTITLPAMTEEQTA